MSKNNSYKVREHQLYLVKPDVWKNLRDNNVIDSIYKKRSRLITFFSTLSFPFQAIQRFIYRKKLKNINLNEKPPVFILGHWRSGTTHLHYILSKDPQFGVLSNYQNFLFNISLLNNSWVKQLLAKFMPDTRPQDNIILDADKPAEEEQPLSMMSVRSGLHSWYFPHNQTYFEKYNLFKNIDEREKKAWQNDYIECLQHISYANNNKQLLLKNPHNTSRVKELLELFPNAKFITIHRNPKDVFLSTRHLYHRMVRTQFLQFLSIKDIDKLIVSNYKKVFEKYNREKGLIPEQNLFELDYHDLISHPQKVVRDIYNQLNINGYEDAIPHIKHYLKSVKGFKTNTFNSNNKMPDINLDELLSELKSSSSRVTSY